MFRNIQTHLDNVDSANAVLAANLVESNEDLDTVGDLLALGDELDGNTLLERNGNVSGLVRSLARVDGLDPHVVGGRNRGIFEGAGLVTAVALVLVHTVGLGLGGGNGDLLLSGVVKEIATALEAVAELLDSPGSDDLDLRVNGKESQLETDTVVALASAAVRDIVTALLLSNAHLSTGDHRAGQTGSKQISSLVLGVALHGTVAELLDELAAEVEDNHLGSTNLLGLGPDGLPVLLLTNIGEEADNLIALVQEPSQNGAGIETACGVRSVL